MKKILFRLIVSMLVLSLNISAEECNDDSSLPVVLQSGLHFKKVKDYANAAKCFEIACENESSDGCFMAGVVNEMMDPKKYQKRSLKYYGSSCYGGNADGCIEAGGRYWASGNGLFARNMFERGCAVDKRVCGYVFMMNLRGIVSEMDSEEKMDKEMLGFIREYKKLKGYCTETEEELPCGYLHKVENVIEHNPIFTDYFENLAKGSKWISPSSSICQAKGGKFDSGACKANWLQAEKICRASGGQLPSIDELRDVVTMCGGVVNDVGNNLEDLDYQQCYSKMGFSSSNNYWSSTAITGDDDVVWYVRFRQGDDKMSMKSKSRYVRCVKDGKINDAMPSWCTAPKLNKTEHTICTDDTLSALDIKLAEIYGASKVRSKDVSQKLWLKKRNDCGSNISCIKNAYEERIRSLLKISKKDIQKEKTMQEQVTEQKHLPPKSDTSLDKVVLKNIKKSMHYILDRDMKAFANITDSGRVYTKKEFERLTGSETSWKKNFPFLDGVTHADIDSLQIYKKAHRDKERTCRYVATGKKVPCKSLEYCFTIDDKTLPKKGCLDMYYIQGKIYWEPYGW